MERIPPTMIKEIEDIQLSLSDGSVDEALVNENPLTQFKIWLLGIEALGLFPYPNAATVSTASDQGIPSSRVVLIKDYDEDGFVFYTNYTSRKGADLNENPVAVINFYWPVAEQQVNITGSVTKISSEEAEDYFSSRPRGSRIGAWASPQSDPVEDRAALDEEYARVQEMYTGKEIPKPDRWGGYRLVPTRYEFWMARQDRFHDRIRYDLLQGEWRIQRIAP